MYFFRQGSHRTDDVDDEPASIGRSELQQTQHSIFNILQEPKQTQKLT